MFQRKSFNLINEEDVEKAGKRKRHGLKRGIVFLAIICIMLTLILVNVDFTKDHFENSIPAIQSSSATTFTTYSSTFANEAENPLSAFSAVNSLNSFQADTETFNTSVEMVEALTESKGVQRFVGPLERVGDVCFEKANPCILSCSGNFDEKALSKRLEDQYKICQNDMEVTIQGVIIRTLGRNWFSGNFRLKKLGIFNCFTDAIDNNAFNKASLKNLKQLIIADTSVSKLNSLTFNGLESLEHFEMIVKDTYITLDAKDFLMPMADTLTRLIFKKQSFMRECDPTPWLNGGDNDYKQLTDVNLSDNYFPNSLNRDTFKRLIGVKNLNLKNCHISHFGENTFLPLKRTLQTLDLSCNELKTLSNDFFLSMSGAAITFLISENPWDCSCHSWDFVENIQNIVIDFEQEPKCSSPPHLAEIIIKNAICCEPNENCKARQGTTTISTFTTIDMTHAIATTLEPTQPSAHLPSPLPSASPDPKNPDPEKNDEPPDIQLSCRSWPTDRQSIFKLHIKQRFIAYTIHIVTPTSVLLEVKLFEHENKIKEYFEMFYYVPKIPGVMSDILIRQKITYLELMAKVDYVFCAIPSTEEINDFSPLNCRGYSPNRLNENSNKSTTWLKSTHMPLVISLATFGVVIFLAIGVVTIFLLLRWRPTLLRGSKRLFRFNSSGCKQVFLTKENDNLSQADLYDALRTYSSLYNSQMHNLNNNDYLQYNRGLDDTSSSPHAIYSSINLAPIQRAPARPPPPDVDSIRPLSQQSTIAAHDAISLASISIAAGEHDYQCLEQYQQIY